MTKILFVSEASYLSTGYATYSREVIKRLVKMGYEVAELSIYGSPDDKLRSTIPWKNYPNLPGPDDKEGIEKYRSSPLHQFGNWRFERVLADFQADAVLTIRDPWVDAFIASSPFRPYFKWIWMSTIDSAPMAVEWIDTFCQTDAMLTYSDWAIDLLKRQAGDYLNVLGAAPPSAQDEFNILDKAKCKEGLGISADTRIIGMAARNQRRKLFPDLFRAFRKFLDRTGDINTYLYIHTSFPDNGWALGQLIVENNVSSRTLINYHCSECENVFASFFSNTVRQCPKCQKFTAKTTSVSNGVSVSKLAEIYNCMDLYVQYSSCFPAGQKVMVNGRWKNIEEVVVGDTAFTHHGRYSQVTNVFKNQYDGKTLEFSVHGDYEKVECTPEHPIYAITEDTCGKTAKSTSLREWIGSKLKQGCEMPVPQFVQASELSPGDMIAFRIDSTVNDIDELDLVDIRDDDNGYIITETEYRHKNVSVSHDRKISVDNDFCQWLGLYVADGSTSNGNIRVTSNIKDVENHRLCEKVMSRFGNLSYQKYKDRLAIDHGIANCVLGRIMLDWCGKHELKKLPEWTMQLTDEKISKVLVGLCMGDGHFVKGITAYVTISELLASQIKHICRRLGLTYNVRIVVRGGKRKPQYRFEIRGDIANGKIDKSRQSTSSVNDGVFYYYQVKDIVQKDHSGYVYNFEVDGDNSYCTKIGNVHNCEGLGIPWVEAAACGVPVLATGYSAMESEVPKVGGDLIPYKLYREMETGTHKAVPDNDFVADYFATFMAQPESVRRNKGFKTREGFLANFSWDKTAKKWADAIESVGVVDKRLGWESPSKAKKVIPPEEFPKFDNNKQFMDWMFGQYIGMPEKIGTHTFNAILRDLNQGQFKNNPGGFFYSDMSAHGKPEYQPLTREILVQMLHNKLMERNFWEDVRVGKVQLKQEDWLL